MKMSSLETTSYVVCKNDSEYRKKDAELYQRIFRDLQRCKKCKYFTRSIFCIQNHLKRHKSQRQKFNCQESTPEEYFCGECRFSTHLKAYFIKHIREYHCLKKEDEETTLDLKTYRCEKSSFWTYSSLVLLKHQMSCKCTDKVKLFRCDYCKFTTKISYNLKYHMYCKHSCDVDIEFHRCDQCHYKTTISRHLKQHKISIHHTKEHQCDQCEFQTIYIMNLKRHKVCKHKTDDLEYLRCDFCDYKSLWSSSIKDHIQRKHARFENLS